MTDTPVKARPLTSREGDMTRVIDLETLTLKSPEELGVRLYPSPPRGFDPVRAGDRELLEYGFPSRPDAVSQPAAYAMWSRVTSPSITRIEPVFGVPPRWPTGHRPPPLSRVIDFAIIGKSGS